jgi:hypothetical protein
LDNLITSVQRIHQQIIIHLTMPKAKLGTLASKLVDSDMEEDEHNRELDALPTPETDHETSAPVRKGRATRGRPRATTAKGAKAKLASRRLSGRLAVVKKEAAPQKKPTAKRVALKERRNKGHPEPENAGIEDDQPPYEIDDHESTASVDELGAKEQVSKRRPPTKKQAEPEVVQETKTIENDGGFEYTPTAVRRTRAHKKSLQAKQALDEKRNPSVDPQYASKVIPETQATPMDLDSSNFPDGDADPHEVVPDSVFRKPSGKRASSRQPQSFLATRRAGSASEIEGANGDSSTRRRLEEMTEKFEDLDTRYKTLKEVGIKEAQVNFERLKEQSEAKTQGRLYLSFFFLANPDLVQLPTTSSIR